MLKQIFNMQYTNMDSLENVCIRMYVQDLLCYFWLRICIFYALVYLFSMPFYIFCSSTCRSCNERGPSGLCRRLGTRNTDSWEKSGCLQVAHSHGYLFWPQTLSFVGISAFLYGKKSTYLNASFEDTLSIMNDKIPASFNRFEVFCDILPSYVLFLVSLFAGCAYLCLLSFLKLIYMKFRSQFCELFLLMWYDT